MAYPTGWGRKCAIVIQSSQVPASLTDFPLLLTEDTLPSEMFDANGSYPALNGGGDIRFSSDADGNTQLACEIVSFVTDNNPANGEAEIWVKVPSVSSSANTTIYVWYNKSGESQPIPSDTYGSEIVWANYNAVWHMTGLAASSDKKDNAEGTSGLDLSEDNTPSSATGKFGTSDGAYSYNTASNEATRVSSPSKASGKYSLFTVSGWAKFDDSSNNQYFYDERSSAISLAFLFYTGSGFQTNRQTYAKSIVTGQWYHLALSYDGTNSLVYIDGVMVDSISWSPGTGSSNIGVGSYGGNTNYTINGDLDEIKVGEYSNDDIISTEYNNQNSPSTFAVEGTPETPGGGTPSSFLSQIIMS